MYVAALTSAAQCCAPKGWRTLFVFACLHQLTTLSHCSEENERLRERLSRAEAELRRLKGSPVAGPRAWLGGQVRRSGRHSP